MITGISATPPYFAATLTTAASVMASATAWAAWATLMVAVLVFGLAWRIGMLSGLGVLLMALPYPKPTVFGKL